MYGLDHPSISLAALRSSSSSSLLFQLLLALAGRGLGDVAVILRVDDEHGPPQLGADAFEVRADLVAVARVVDHDEQHRLLAERLVPDRALAPLLDAELQVVGVALGKDGALLLDQTRAARGVRQHRVLDHVLADRLDERVVRHGLHEDRAVVVARRGGDVDLQREARILLEHPVMDVLDALEPRHPGIVDVVRLVVEDGQFRDVADDFAQIGPAFVGRADRLRPERGEEVVAQVLVVGHRLAALAQEHAVDVGEEQVADPALHADVVLDVHGHLEIVAPVAAVLAVRRQDRVVEEDPEAVEVVPQPVQDDDVRRDQQDVPGERGVGLVELVEVAPCDQEREDLGLARTGGELEHVAGPGLVEHAGGHGARAVEAHQVDLVAHLPDVVQPDDRLDRLPLREVVAERRQRAVGVLDEVLGVEPPFEQGARRGRGAAITVVAPPLDLGANLRDQRRDEILVGRVAQLLGGGKPARRRIELVVGRNRKVGV